MLYNIKTDPDLISEINHNQGQKVKCSSSNSTDRMLRWFE
jgi:hypothetical protein